MTADVYDALILVGIATAWPLKRTRAWDEAHGLRDNTGRMTTRGLIVDGTISVVGLVVFVAIHLWWLALAYAVGFVVVHARLELHRRRTARG